MLWPTSRCSIVVSQQSCWRDALHVSRPRLPSHYIQTWRLTLLTARPTPLRPDPTVSLHLINTGYK